MYLPFAGGVSCRARTRKCPMALLPMRPVIGSPPSRHWRELGRLKNYASAVCVSTKWLSIAGDPDLGLRNPTAAHERGHRRHQLARIDRLGEMHLEPLLQRLGAVFGPREC